MVLSFMPQDPVHVGKQGSEKWVYSLARMVSLSFNNYCGRTFKKDLKKMCVEIREHLDLRSTGGTRRVQHVTVGWEAELWWRKRPRSWVMSPRNCWSGCWVWMSTLMKVWTGVQVGVRWGARSQCPQWRRGGHRESVVKGIKEASVLWRCETESWVLWYDGRFGNVIRSEKDISLIWPPNTLWVRLIITFAAWQDNRKHRPRFSTRISETMISLFFGKGLFKFESSSGLC